MTHLRKALVTGGAGAIGGTLVARLVRDGWDVLVVDDLSSGRRENLPSGIPFFWKGSITDEALLDEIFDQKPQVIFHLAAHFANQNSVEHPLADLDTNTRGTLMLLERALKSGVQRFVYASSSCVYGSAAEMTEDVIGMELDTPYAISKMAGERYVRFFGHHYGLGTVSLRYFNSYGPGDLPGPYRNVIPNFFARALRGQALVITGTGEETRDFTYVSDTVEATIRAGVQPLDPGEVLNIGGGRPTEILTLAQKINALTKNSAGIEYKPRRGWDGIPHRRANVKKMASLLGYTPSTTLDDGLNQTYRWILTEQEAFLR